ncbi:MAG: hypothetical protein ACJ8AW_03840, partial [Rhodopila sp.]
IFALTPLFNTVSPARPLAPRWVKMRPERRQLAPMNSISEAEGAEKRLLRPAVAVDWYRSFVTCIS